MKQNHRSKDFIRAKKLALFLRSFKLVDMGDQDRVNQFLEQHRNRAYKPYRDFLFLFSRKKESQLARGKKINC